MSNKQYFPHIDGLRAIAVIAVIVYHMNEDFLAGGYLGVDLFFVISGFVITGCLLRMDTTNIQKSLVEFYVRRLKRLMPALIASIVVSSTLFLLLTTRPPIDIFNTAAAAIFGLSNNYLYWMSEDYFSLDAMLNPFTHTWSLGVEEQFYLIYPAVLVLLGVISKARHNATNHYLLYIFLPLLWGASFLGYIVMVHIETMAAFYLLPFRLWELGVGCFTYYFYIRANSRGKLKKPSKRWVSSFSLIVLCCCLLVPDQYQLYSTVVLVFSSIFVILDNDEKSIVNRALSLPVMVWIGLLSYSFYLWHWPVLVLAKYTIGNQGVPLLITATIFVAISVASYYLIERPFRHAGSQIDQRVTGVIYFTVMSFVAIILIVQAPKHSQSYNNVLADVFDVPPTEKWVDDVDCHGSADLQKKASPLEDCLGAERTEAQPNIIYLVGDSHAAQLFFMFEEAVKGTGYQLRFMNDGSIVGLGRTKNSYTLEYIVSQLKAGDIVAVAFHRGHLNESRDKHIPLKTTIEHNLKSLNFKSSFVNYQKQINALGGTVLFIRDTPLMASVMTSPSCRLQIEMFGESVCKVFLSQDIHTRTRQDALYDEILQLFPSNCVWDPLPELYKESEYLDVINAGKDYIMWDWHHLTKSASKQLASEFRPDLLLCINIAQSNKVNKR